MRHAPSIHNSDRTHQTHVKGFRFGCRKWRCRCYFSRCCCCYCCGVLSPYLALFYSFDSRFAAIAVAVGFFVFLIFGSHSEFFLFFYGFKFVILQQHISCEFWCFHFPVIFIIFYCILCVWVCVWECVFIWISESCSVFFAVISLFSSRCGLSSTSNVMELKTKTRIYDYGINNPSIVRKIRISRVHERNMGGLAVGMSVC